MGTHFGATPKQIADDIAQLSDHSYTTYVKNGIKRYVWTYLSSGTFKTPNYGPTCDVLVVAGGGGAGAEYAGGGGAGGVLWGQSIIVSPDTYSIVIGAGGTSPNGSGTYDTTPNDGENGTDTTAFGVTAIGGGGGDGYDNINENGKDGGSGGGNSLYVTQSPHDDASASTQTAPNASWTAYGNGGGATSTHTNRGGTGGGGAGGAGGTNTSAGNGGPGGVGISTLAGLTTAATAALLWSAQIGTNSSNALVSGLGSNPGTIYIAGGGSGNSHQGTSTVEGGAGGGGSGISGTTFNVIQNADDNTGGGGGAMEGYASSTHGGVGGSGIVIISIPGG
jgi:hypothetical protein